MPQEFLKSLSDFTKRISEAAIGIPEGANLFYYFVFIVGSKLFHPQYVWKAIPIKFVIFVLESVIFDCK